MYKAQLKDGEGDEERATREFCQDLRELSDVTEIRGCSRKRIGQAMIGCGIYALKESEQDSEEALRLANIMIEAWSGIIDDI